MKRVGCKFGEGKTRSCPSSKVGDLYFCSWYPNSKTQYPPSLPRRLGGRKCGQLGGDRQYSILEWEVCWRVLVYWLGSSFWGGMFVSGFFPGGIRETANGYYRKAVNE